MRLGIVFACFGIATVSTPTCARRNCGDAARFVLEINEQVQVKQGVGQMNGIEATAREHRLIGETVVGLCLFATVAISTAAAAQFTTLHRFAGTDGYQPEGALVQATNGDLYGITTFGGINGNGTIYKITPGGALTTVYSFCAQSGCPDGNNPFSAPIQATDGNLYGASPYGGAYGFGTIYRLTLNGTLTTLYSFNNTDGANPSGNLIQAANGHLYGTTTFGGPSNDGTVFKITTSGTLTTLHSFDGTDGANTQVGLTQAKSGDFYGVTELGGNGYGTVFKMTSTGNLTTLHSFDNSDGAYPLTPLIQATNGDFYSTTSAGGLGGAGTVYKLTASGTLTTIYTFCVQPGCPDGSYPAGALIQATNGDFYGTTFGGGSSGAGVIFQFSARATPVVVHSFGGTGGVNPIEAGVIQDTNGSFYGNTAAGGAGNLGTLYSLSLGLGAFVESQVSSGKAGATVKILGSNLTGASKVSFNGTAATFTVVSKSEIVTMVPTGATTGVIEVTTPGGVLKSNKMFTVTS